MSVAVSVVVPVYNSQDTVKRCLESIAAQTFSNFEAIIIDDGSTDHSPNICDDFAITDDRFKVVHTKNSGVSSARNKGIDLAQGDWTCFVDSDDYVEGTYLENLMVNTKHVELVIAGLKRISKKNTVFVTFPEKIVGVEYRQFYFQEYPLSDSGYPVSKLFNRQILHENNIRFNNHIHMFEDVLFLFSYLLFCKKIKFCSHASYNYMILNSTLSTKINDFESEYLGFISIYNLLLTEYNITQTELINKYPALGFRVSRLMNRCISVLYLKSYPSNYCIQALQDFPKQAWGFFDQFVIPENIVKKVVKFLLVRRMFRISNLLLRLSYNLKR
ncbi:glycosyltransferase family 2 protein [Litoribacter ruber]|uniref:glycosyltransferase family 2 protein n=1 Tax=Litoribacter ruber TaxID=702568 RepID=UPI001BD9CEC6|nr:glycosyltransferase family 2 protein [Litoribacter ruber]MBT0813048.1 glycosyltransferase family 2 protein [Litoribacter ruber]